MVIISTLIFTHSIIQVTFIDTLYEFKIELQMCELLQI